jgi:PAS domain S-box-containing protein
MLDSFFIYGPPPLGTETGVYQPPLVILSYIVATFASYTALSLAQQLVGASGVQEKRLLHLGGAFAMGAGIWSMHFIGMLSYKMSMVITYDPLLTLLSMLIATGFSYGVLAIITKERLTVIPVLIGAVLLGLGICGMHYTGMAAMQMDGDLYYRPLIFFYSIVIAVVASAGALLMAFTLARRTIRYRYLYQLSAALIMGAAICGMHYTGMAAAVFVPWANCRYDPNQNFTMLAISIAGITGMILLIALGRGIYKKAQTEAQLQNTRALLASIIESSDDAILSKTLNGTITSWNKGAERLFGYSTEEAVGKHISIIIPPELISEDQYIVSELGAGRAIDHLETVRKNKNGRKIDISLTISPIRDAMGKVVGASKIAHDITARKKTEERLAAYTKELEDSNRELDDFAYIASHDLKEPLRGLHNFSRFLLEDYEDKLDDEAKNMLHTIAGLTQRMDGLLSALLHYSRLGRTELSVRETDLNETVRKALDMHSIKIEESGVDVQVHELPSVICDYVRISEVFQNLIGNALKYNDKSERKIEIGSTKNHSDYLGKEVYFVKDNGIGIEKKDFESIFKIFRRLHAQDAYGGGTGSGLTIVKKIIARHGGRIWVESAGKGQGTTFFFTIPSQQTPA